MQYGRGKCLKLDPKQQGIEFEGFNSTDMNFGHWPKRVAHVEGLGDNNAEYKGLAVCVECTAGEICQSKRGKLC